MAAQVEAKPNNLASQQQCMGTFGCSLKLKCNTHTHTHISFRLCSHLVQLFKYFFLSFLLFSFSFSHSSCCPLSLLRLPHFLSSSSFHLCRSATQSPQTHLTNLLPSCQPSSDPPLVLTHLADLPNFNLSHRSITKSTGTFSQFCPFFPFSQFAFRALCVCVCVCVCLCCC